MHSNNNIDTTCEVIVLQDNNVIRVDVRVVFLELHDIETIYEKYTAEIYVESRWRCDKNLEMIQDYESISSDWQPKWEPKLKVENIITESSPKVWYRIIQVTDDEVYIIQMLRFKGTMYEKLELENYPFDIQRLNLDVISNQPISKCLLVNNNDSNPSIVLTSNFRDSQEWYLHNFVGVEKNFTSSSKYSIDDSVHSKLKFFCVVSRKPGYFYWNAFYLIFIISAMSFNVFSVSVTSYPQRLSATTTLVLTSVSFKWVINRSLPPIAYLTSLDLYSIIAISFLVILSCWHAIVGYFFNGENAKRIDFIFLLIIASIYFLYQLSFLLYLFLCAFGPRRFYAKEERNYKKKISDFDLKPKDKVLFQSSD